MTLIFFPHLLLERYTKGLTSYDRQDAKYMFFLQLLVHTSEKCLYANYIVLLQVYIPIRLKKGYGSYEGNNKCHLSRMLSFSDMCEHCM